MDRGDWWATVHEVTKSRTLLSFQHAINIKVTDEQFKRFVCVCAVFERTTGISQAQQPHMVHEYHRNSAGPSRCVLVV